VKNDTGFLFLQEQLPSCGIENETGLRMKSHSRPVTPLSANASSQEIAKRFVSARRNAAPLNEFPGEIPADLNTAYSIQDFAISLWPGKVAGWKVGRIPPHLEDGFGIDRLAGPVFCDMIFFANSGDTVEMATFEGGFAAIEAEYVAVIAHDAPPEKMTWSRAESGSMIDKVCIGIEIASSPLGTINELGPAVVVSDFGNNAGLIVGPPIGDWQSRKLESMQCSSYIDDTKVGDGGAFALDGGLLRSVQFLLELKAQHGTPLRAGDVVATGQTTGIHDIEVGQVGRLDFGEDGVLNCVIVAATAE